MKTNHFFLVCYVRIATREERQAPPQAGLLQVRRGPPEPPPGRTVGAASSPDRRSGRTQTSDVASLPPCSGLRRERSSQRRQAPPPPHLQARRAPLPPLPHAPASTSPTPDLSSPRPAPVGEHLCPQARTSAPTRAPALLPASTTSDEVQIWWWAALPWWTVWLRWRRPCPETPARIRWRAALPRWPVQLWRQANPTPASHDRADVALLRPPLAGPCSPYGRTNRKKYNLVIDRWGRI